MNMVKLVKPKSWKSHADGAGAAGSYCGHTKEQHKNGRGPCMVSQGESFCWCRRFRQIDDLVESRKAMLRIAREAAPALKALAEIVDLRTRSTLLRLHRGLMMAVKKRSSSGQSRNGRR